jgi:ABC-type transport system substrate-binding protein
MRSTRRSEAYAGLVALGFLAGVITLIAVFIPDEPTSPRWRGAGHDEPRYGGTFVFHHESDAEGFDPQKSFNELSTMGIKLFYEGLVDYDPEDVSRFVPRLAESLPTRSEDGRTYTYRLRSGVRFADSEVFPGGRGRELVASDVKWSLEHMIHADTASPGATFYAQIVGYEEFRAGRASHISGIRVRDRRTVEITLSAPDRTFEFAMAMPFAYPVAREAYEFYSSDQVMRHPVSTGAYLLERWEPGVEIVLRRNPNYFDAPRPYVDRMIYTLNLQRQAAVMRFRNGDLDHIHRQTPGAYRRLRDMPAWAPYRSIEPKVNLWGVAMNCELEPFTNRHVRRAVSFAINGPLWRRARANRLQLTGQPIPRQLMGFDESLPGRHHYDLARAREEMRLAGYPNGLPEPVEIWLGEGPTGRSYGELLQQDLRAIGIEVHLRQVAFPVFLERTGTRRTAQMLLGGWNMDFPDPSNFLDILFHTRSIHEENSENKSFYSNPALDEILDRARVEPDDARREEMYREASRIIVDDAPWAFVWSDVAMEMWQPYVRNYRVHPVWSNFYRDIWLDLPRQRVTSATRERAGRLAFLAPFAGMVR